MLPKHLMFFLAAVLLTATAARAQSTWLDSLKKNIGNAKSPAEKLNTVMTFCDEWESYSPDTLLSYIKQAQQLAAAQNAPDKMIIVSYYRAACLMQKDSLDNALTMIRGVLRSYKAIKPYDRYYPKFYSLQGNVLNRQGKQNEAINASYEELDLATKNKDTTGMIAAMAALSRPNALLGNYKEALSWCLRCLPLMHDDLYRKKMSYVYVNTAAVYYHIEQKGWETNDSSMYFAKEAVLYARQGSNLSYRVTALMCYAAMLNHKGMYKEADSAYTEALEAQKKIGDFFYTNSLMGSIARNYASSGQLQKGLATALQAQDMARQNNDTSFLTMTGIIANLRDIYAQMNDYKHLSEVLQEQADLFEKNYNSNTAGALAEMQTRYETQKKEATILRQKYDLVRKNYWIYGSLAALLATLIVAFAFFRNYRKIQRLKLQEIAMDNERKTTEAISKARDEERRRILADLHDDVGGGLSSIRMVSDLIIRQHEQVQQVNDYALKISGITKEVSQQMNTIVWALNSENDTLQNLCEYIRQYGYNFFENSAIQFRSELQEHLPAVELSGLQRKNIFLCVKEALHNTLKHSGASWARVDIVVDGQTLGITITDNGKGIVSENKFGNGLKSMQKRMQEISGHIKFESANGTIIRLTVPFNTGSALSYTS